MKAKILFMCFSLILFSIILNTQPQRPPRFYNPDTVVSVSGEVQNVETRTFGPSGAGLLILSLKTEKEIITVNVGPERYVSSLGFSFSKGDKIEVKGSKVDIRGVPTILAAEIKKGEKTLKLREEDGTPLWRGPRR